MVMKLKEVALYPESVDTMQSEDDQKKFVITFRELTKYLQSLQTFIEFSLIRMHSSCPSRSIRTTRASI